MILINPGHGGSRGPPRAGLGAHGAAPNLPVPNLPSGSPNPHENGSNEGGAALGGGMPVENLKIFMSGVPSSLSDQRFQAILEVCPFLQSAIAKPMHVENGLTAILYIHRPSDKQLTSIVYEMHLANPKVLSSSSTQILKLYYGPWSYSMVSH